MYARFDKIRLPLSTTIVCTRWHMLYKKSGGSCPKLLYLNLVTESLVGCAVVWFQIPTRSSVRKCKPPGFRRILRHGPSSYVPGLVLPTRVPPYGTCFLLVAATGNTDWIRVEQNKYGSLPLCTAILTRGAPALAPKNIPTDCK